MARGGRRHAGRVYPDQSDKLSYLQRLHRVLRTRCGHTAAGVYSKIGGLDGLERGQPGPALEGPLPERHSCVSKR